MFSWDTLSLLCLHVVAAPFVCVTWSPLLGVLGRLPVTKPATKLLQDKAPSAGGGLSCDDDSERKGGSQVWPEGRQGFYVRVEGFSHKLPALTADIFSHLANLTVPLSC